MCDKCYVFFFKKFHVFAKEKKCRITFQKNKILSTHKKQKQNKKGSCVVIFSQIFNLLFPRSTPVLLLLHHHLSSLKSNFSEDHLGPWERLAKLKKELANFNVGKRKIKNKKATWVVLLVPRLKTRT